MQQEQSNKKWIFIFTTIVLLFVVLFFVAYMIAGDKGIEERFSDALGLHGESESCDNGILGFKLEGNPLSYGIILALMLVATALIYARFKV